MAKPVLKWAGGKTVILKEIEKRLNNIETNHVCFYDVFAGGASVIIKFHNKFKKCVINDTNKELKHVYDSIKKNSIELISLLDRHAQNHSHDYFYKIRLMDREMIYETMSDVEKAARTIYLNKTCYNGLYRVNSKGEFNVPLGRQKNISIYDAVNISELSKILQNVEILNKDFSVVLKECKAGDVVYIDPPYDKINNLSFVEYNVSRFDEFDQERLKREIDELTEKGVYVIASNSHTDNTAKLYKDYITENSIIKVKRSIASKNSSRQPVEEILIDNIEKVNKNASKNQKT